MKRHIASLALAAVALFFTGCQNDTPLEPIDSSPDFGAAAGSSAQAAGFEYADHYIMGYYYVSPQAADIIEAAGGSYETSPTGYGVVRGISEDDADELRKMDGIRSVTRDIIIQWIPDAEQFAGTREAPSTESDQSGAFFFAVGTQWNISQIDADAAWLVTNQGSGTKVAVLDTGTDPFHQDLAGKIDGASTSVLTPGSSPCGAFDEDNVFDLNFHGSFVSGLVASNGIDMASVAPDASILGVKVLNCFGFGSFSDVNAGIIYAASVGADVINMSLGALFATETDDDDLDEEIQELIDSQQAAIDFAVDNGVLVVAAAGNGGLNFDDLPDEGDCFIQPSEFGPGSCDDLDVIHIPSMLDDVLSVGATAPVGQANFDQLASYSNFGDHGADVMAPGGDLVAGSSCNLIGIPGGGGPFTCDLVLSVCSSFVCGASFFYLLSAGTSFASPLAAGTAAVVISEGEDADDCVEDGADEIEDLSPEERINVLGAAQCESLEVADDDDDENDDDEHDD